MDPTVLNVVLYLYEHFLDENEEAPPRAALENILHTGGVPAATGARALDWLEVLATDEHPAPIAAADHARRIFNASEGARLSTEARGLLLQLEQEGILDSCEREIVIERALALDEREVGLEALQWVVLLTLFHRPGREGAFAEMQDICYAEDDLAAPH